MKIERMIWVICLLVAFGAVTCNHAGAGAKKRLTGDDWVGYGSEKKLDAIKAFIAAADAKGVTISKDASAYVRELDAFYEKHEELKSERLAVVLKTLMMLGRDWSVKGVDSDLPARKWLGEELYNKSRMRIGSAQSR